MTRTIPFFYIVLAGFVVFVAGCDQLEELTGDESSAEVSIDGDAERTAAAFLSFTQPINEMLVAQCQCEYDRRFDSEDECIAHEARTDEELEAVETCVAGRLSAHSKTQPMPDGVVDFFECVEGGPAGELEGCIDSVRSEHDDTCSDDAVDAWRACHDDFMDSVDECSREIPREAEQWMGDVDSDIDNCLATIDHFDL